MSGMTRRELSLALAAEAEISDKKALDIIKLIFNAMSDALNRGERIELRGFGVFTVRDYKPYMGQCPLDNSPRWIEAKRLPFFKVGRSLHRSINQRRK